MALSKYTGQTVNQKPITAVAKLNVTEQQKKEENKKLLIIGGSVALLVLIVAIVAAVKISKS